MLPELMPLTKSFNLWLPTAGRSPHRAKRRGSSHVGRNLDFPKVRKFDYTSIPDILKDSGDAIGKTAMITQLQMVDEIKPNRTYRAKDETGNKVLLNLVGKISISREFAKTKRLQPGTVYAIAFKITGISSDRVVEGNVEGIGFPHEVPTSIARKSEKIGEERAQAEDKVARVPQQREPAQKGGEQIQKTSEIRTLPNNGFLFLMGTDAETGAKFWRYSRDRSNPCWNFGWGNGTHAYEAEIICEVPDSISLVDDKVARSLVMKTKQMATNKCGLATRLHIMLVPQGYQVAVDSNEYANFNPIHVYASFTCDYHWDGHHRPAYSGKCDSEQYRNTVLAKEQARLKGEQKKKDKEEAKKTFDEFVKKNGVQELVSWNKLNTNPYVYEGKIVAIRTNFYEMRSANLGLFMWVDDVTLVSNTPKALFTKQATVLLAGQVVGKLQGVPHLKFVGVHFCKDRDCSDIIVK